jgi:hypothetical protein
VERGAYNHDDTSHHATTDQEVLHKRTGGQLPHNGESFYVNMSSMGPPGNKRFDGANPQHVVNIVDFQNGGNVINRLNIYGLSPRCLDSIAKWQ